jgi:putative ABC transport system permease protein
MLKNYFIIAFRNFRHNKVFSAINMVSLAIGISAALVIYLVVQYEFSFEHEQPDKERVYRVVTDIQFPGQLFKNSGVPMPTPQAMRNDLTGIETATHFITGIESKVVIPTKNDQPVLTFKKQKDLAYADEYYFSMFPYTWLAGSKKNILKEPLQVVLTESRAKAYFGNVPFNNMIGREVIYNDSIKVTVAGIVKEKTGATDFIFKEFISLATITTTGLKEHFSIDDWGSINSNSQLFVKLTKGVTPRQVEAKFPAFRKKYLTKKDEKDDTYHHLQAITDMHFNADYDVFEQRQAHKPTLYSLLAVAAFLLLLGCINFINLTTAQSTQRAKEIGIRKTMGSKKSQLVFQFLTETFVLTVLATILSIVITPWILKAFHNFIPSGVSFASINQGHVWLFLILLMITVSVLSGIYPALVLTRFNPATVLKNQAFTGSSQTRTAWLRKTLTVTQFVIAQFLLIATLVVSKQIYYSIHKDLGYKKDAIVYFYVPANYYSDKPDNRCLVLLEKIKAIPEIEKASLAGNSPASAGSNFSTMAVNNGKKVVDLLVETKNADPAYFDIYKLKLLTGRLPQESDTVREYVINETYAKTLGFLNPGEAVGKIIDRKRYKAPIVGVLADFHTKSTHAAIKPLAFASAKKDSYVFHLALQPAEYGTDTWKTGLAKVEKAYKGLFPDDDFSYTFFDKSIAEFYKSEQNISSLLKWSAGLCILISCLGLLGLVMYTTNIRTKEIGIRKVLGASVTQLVALLTKDLLLLILIAFVIASPIAWWAMYKWLENFAYRTSISWWIFLVCAVSMTFIALLVLCIRTFRTAMANPVKSLRTE